MLNDHLSILDHHVGKLSQTPKGFGHDYDGAEGEELEAGYHHTSGSTQVASDKSIPEAHSKTQPKIRIKVQAQTNAARRASHASHMSQVRQGRDGETATASPTRNVSTPAPTAAMRPATSCPRIIGSFNRMAPKPP